LPAKFLVISNSQEDAFQAGVRRAIEESPFDSSSFRPSVVTLYVVARQNRTQGISHQTVTARNPWVSRLPDALAFLDRPSP